MISPFYIKNVAKQFYHSEAKSSSLCGVFIEQWFAKYKQFILKHGILLNGKIHTWSFGLSGLKAHSVFSVCLVVW